VGLPDTAVQESRERVQSAIKNAGLPFPRKRVLVNMAPADVRKEGPVYDLRCLYLQEQIEKAKRKLTED
jgi:magnesium chelatase family protein